MLRNSRLVKTPAKRFARAFLGFFGVLSITASAAAAADVVYVTVRESKLRAKSDFFSTPSGDVRYGDRLEVLSEDGSWLRVKTGAKQGFIHSSSITEKKVVLKSGTNYQPTTTDQSDVVLAGKGFNAEVEKQFAAAHRNLNFVDVNAMEKIKVTPAELVAFVNQGKLGGGN